MEKEREREKVGGNNLRTNWAKIVKSIVPCLLSCVSKLVNQVIIKLDALNEANTCLEEVGRESREHARSSQSGPSLALYFPLTFLPPSPN
jgi:uncharacterized metal-binding protein